jgi:hypothetical protein
MNNDLNHAHASDHKSVLSNNKLDGTEKGTNKPNAIIKCLKLNGNRI